MTKAQAARFACWLIFLVLFAILFNRAIEDAEARTMPSHMDTAWANAHEAGKMDTTPTYDEYGIIEPSASSYQVFWCKKRKATKITCLLREYNVNIWYTYTDEFVEEPYIDLLIQTFKTKKGYRVREVWWSINGDINEEYDPKRSPDPHPSA